RAYDDDVSDDERPGENLACDGTTPRLGAVLGRKRDNVAIARADDDETASDIRTGRKRQLRLGEPQTPSVLGREREDVAVVRSRVEHVVDGDRLQRESQMFRFTAESDAPEAVDLTSRLYVDELGRLFDVFVATSRSHRERSDTRRRDHRTGSTPGRLRARHLHHG